MSALLHANATKLRTIVLWILKHLALDQERGSAIENIFTVHGRRICQLECRGLLDSRCRYFLDER